MQGRQIKVHGQSYDYGLIVATQTRSWHNDQMLERHQHLFALTHPPIACWANCITTEVTSDPTYNSRSDIIRHQHLTSHLYPLPSSRVPLVGG